MASTHQQVLNFWFHERTTMQEKQKLWFAGFPGDDKIIRERFSDLVVKARDGKLGQWEDLSEGASGGLAFVILLDQFCRSLYRGTQESFDCDHKSLQVSLRMIDGGMDKQLTHVERVFAYLPLQHCEDILMQEKSVQLYRGLVEEEENVRGEEKGLIRAS